MGDLVVSEDMPTQQPSKFSVKSSNSNAKVSDQANGTGTAKSALGKNTSGKPALMESEMQDSSAKDSAEEVNSSHTDFRYDSKSDQTILGQSEVSLPALRNSKKPERNGITKSATVDSLRSLRSGNVDGSNRFKNLESSRAVVDTTAPIESVRDAVSKLGGIADWKTQRVQTLERRRHIDQELEKVQEEMFDFKQMSNAAEDAEKKVLNELERTNKQIKELELQLSSWSSQIKEQSHDRDLEEVNDETPDAATTRNLRDAQDDINITIQELTAELEAAKESLSAAQVAYKEAEEKRSASIVAFEEESLSWETNLKQVEGEVERLNQEYLYAKDLELKLESASALLSTLKSELGNCIRSKMKQETADAKSKFEIENSKMKFRSAKKEFEQVKLRIEKATTEVGILKLAASSLQSELEKEKEAVSVVTKQVGVASVTIQSLEEELSLIESETAVIEMREKEAREIMVDMPIKLQQAAEEADQAKSLKKTILEVLRKMRDEVEQVKAEACTTETRLHAAEKEIEATKASEKLALAAIHGLQESETALETGNTGSDNVVIISLDEYQMLSYLAQEAEDQAKTRLAAALIQIEAAKKSESKSLQKLEAVSQELSKKKATYGTATKISDKAINEKLRAEQELRSWRTKNEQRRKASQSASFTSESSNIKHKKDTNKSGKVYGANPLQHTQNLMKPASRAQSSVESDSSQDLKLTKKKKKKSLFPTLIKFFGRRKSRASKKVM